MVNNKSNKNQRGGSKKPSFTDANPYGTMAKAMGAEKVRLTTTTSCVITDATVFETAIQATQLYPDGTSFDVSISGSLASIYPSGIPAIYQNFDKFRLKEVEIFASCGATDNFCLTILSSVDIDDALPTGWNVFRTRKNIAMTTLNPTVPSRTLARFKPVPNFAVATGTSSPSNVIPSSNTWIDVSALNQQFLGLKIHVASPATRLFSVDLFAKVTLEYQAQV